MEGESMPPQVSVLLPVYDGADTLAGCLRSLQRQRETRWECVLVDDGSRDATRDIARRFAAEDPRVRVLEVPHAGLVPALRHGLAACRAPLVARMDADDWMHRDRLALQVETLRTMPALAAVGTRVRLFPRAGLTPGRLSYERWLNAIETPVDVRANAFVECPIAHPTLCVRREVLEQLPWRDRGWPEDYDLVLRMLAAGHELAVLPRRLLGWRDSPNRLSRTGPAYRLERFTACKAAFLASGFLATAQQYVLWGYGDTGRELRRALAEHDRVPSHIVELHPGRLGQRIHQAPVIAPDDLPGLPKAPIVVSVAGAGPREQIRAALGRMGFRETTDFVCAA
jgi:glycosyltransferase involved in cell wall biosynthesis